MTRRRSVVRVLLILLVCAIAAPNDAAAQTSRDAARRDRPRTMLWTVVGAAAGFGVGLWAGLTVFDDAVDSDRKVWTTALLSAAGGGVAGYLVGRRGGDRMPPPATGPLIGPGGLGPAAPPGAAAPHVPGEHPGDRGKILDTRLRQAVAAYWRAQRPSHDPGDGLLHSPGMGSAQVDGR